MGRSHYLLGVFLLACSSAPPSELNGLLPPGAEHFAPPALGGQAVAAATPPAPLSGGTLGVVLRERKGTWLDSDIQLWVIASIPEMDTIAVAPFTAMGAFSPTYTVLSPGDEPGRVVGDPQGRAHVVLRGAGDLVSLDPGSGRVITRRHVCPAPRGIVYDPNIDSLHVACASGELVTLPAAGGDATRSLFIERDLRDVVLDTTGIVETSVSNGAKPSALLVSRFREAEVLSIDFQGNVTRRQRLAGSPMGTRSAQVLWRLTKSPRGTVAASFLLDQVRPIDLGSQPLPPQQQVQQFTPPPPYGGSAGSNPSLDGPGPVVLPVVARIGAPSFTFPVGSGYAADIALSRDDEFAVATANGQVVLPFTSMVPLAYFGQATSVAFAEVWSGPVQKRYLVSQWRGGSNPGGALVIYAAPSYAQIQVVSLPGVADTGYELFHKPTTAGVACASCHPEGGDDGHTWTFRVRTNNRVDVDRPRRTQSLRGGVLATAPFHWDGALEGMRQVCDDVYSKRMGGGFVTPAQVALLERFVDAIPAIPPPSNLDPDAVARGKALFESKGCATCHSGAHFTNNLSSDVGTGETLQVPQLVGIGYRAPFMHDGCAATLAGRFDPSCGGDKHGVPSSTAETADLIAYLGTL